MAGTPITKYVTVTASKVQDWKDGTCNNRGVCLKFAAGSTYAKTLKSTENGSLEPYMIIDYDPPPVEGGLVKFKLL